MKVLLAMPRDVYDALLATYELRSPEYVLLINGIVASDEEHGTAIYIVSEPAQLQSLIQRASNRVPAAIPYLEAAQRRQFQTNVA